MSSIFSLRLESDLSEIMLSLQIISYLLTNITAL